MNGTVMKITKTQIVVLCEDGKFRNLPHPQELPALGETMTIPDKKKFYMPKSWIAAAVLVLLIGVTLFWSVLSSNQPVTVVAIDINPSVELFVHPDGKVKDVSLQNDQAVLILNEKDLIHKDVNQALQQIIHLSEKQGFLDPNTQNQVIMISIVGITNDFQIDFHKTPSEHYPYPIYLNDVEKEKQEKAKELDLSLNKYIVFEKANEWGVTLNVDHLRSQSIVQTLEQAGIDPQRFFDEQADRNDIPTVPEEPEDEPVDTISEEDAYSDNAPNQDAEYDASKEDAHNEPEPMDDAPVDDAMVDHSPEEDALEEKAHPEPAPEVNAPENHTPEEDAYSEPAPNVAPEVIPEDEAEVVPEVEIIEDAAEDEPNVQKETFLTIDEFELELELRQRGRKGKKQKYEYVYEYEAEKPNAEMEALLKQLNLQEDMSKAQIVDRVMAVFEIDRSQLRELEIEIEFTNGKEVEIEIEHDDKDNDDHDDDDRKDDRSGNRGSDRDDDRGKKKNKWKDKKKNNRR